MSGLWMAGMAANAAVESRTHSASNKAASMTQAQARDIKELRHQIQRLSLLSQALWELIRDRLQLSDIDLERVAGEIDLRDGIEDGKISAAPLRCPSCGRVSNSKHYRCLYCAQEFAKPLFG